MKNVIALTQFVLIALGTFAVSVLAKTSQQGVDLAGSSDSLQSFLAIYGIWLVAIPVLWTCYSAVAETIQKGPFSTRFAQPLGIVLTAGILGIYLYAIFFGT